MLAHIVDWETAAVDYVHGDDGLLMAPVYAVPRLSTRNNLTFDDFDFIEIHEAFASQVLATLKAWEDEQFCREQARPRRGARESIDRAKLNPQGIVARGRPSVRRDRRPDPGHDREDARREGLRPVADLDLRGGRPGRRGDRRAVESGRVGQD